MFPFAGVGLSLKLSLALCAAFSTSLSPKVVTLHFWIRLWNRAASLSGILRRVTELRSAWLLRSCDYRSWLPPKVAAQCVQNSTSKVPGSFLVCVSKNCIAPDFRVSYIFQVSATLRSFATLSRTPIRSVYRSLRRWGEVFGRLGP